MIGVVRGRITLVAAIKDKESVKPLGTQRDEPMDRGRLTFTRPICVNGYLSIPRPLSYVNAAVTLRLDIYR